MYPFAKKLKLPSNGLSYEAFVELKTITNAFLFGLEDAEFQTNTAEIKATLLKPYLSIDPFEMWYADLLFVWEYVMSSVFAQTEVTKKEICKICKELNEVSVANESLDIVYLENSQEVLNFKIPYNDKELVVYYRRRKTMDNVQSSNDNLELQEALNDPTNYMKFFARLMYPQVVKIQFDSNSIGKPTEKELFDIFVYSQDKIEIINQFYDHLLKNSDFGIINNFNYVCKKCNHHNLFQFFDPITDSFFIKGSKPEKINMHYLGFIKEGFITFSELMNLPVIMNKEFFESCSKILEKESELASGGVDYRKFHGLG